MGILLSNFHLQFQAQKYIKGKAVSEFLAYCLISQEERYYYLPCEDILFIEDETCQMYLHGAFNHKLIKLES